MDKPQLRALYRVKLAAQLDADCERRSQVIIDKVCASAEYRRAKTIFSFVSAGYEVDTRSFILLALQEHKRVAAPRFADGQMETKQISSLQELEFGSSGILQPSPRAVSISVKEIDLVVVPGLGFTPSGDRLGQGGGYFDRWLPMLKRSTPTFGLAFDFQVAEHLPEEPHDVRVTRVITN